MSSSILPAESKPIKILSKKNLLKAWMVSRDCSSNPGGRGVDTVRAISFAAKLDEKCDDIVRDVKSGRIRFSKLKPRSIPKAGSDTERLICIPTVRDRLIQRAMLQYIETKVSVFEVSKYAFKDNGGTHQAIQKCKRLRAEYKYVAKTDIIQFFDNIPRAQLKTQCRRILKSSSLIPLVEQAIDAEIKGHNNTFSDKYGVKKGKGLRQGMPLSPMLSNLALYKLDKFIQKEKIPAIRYVDDIIVFASTKKGAETYISQISAVLSELDLGIPEFGNNSKTELFGPTGKVVFLGVEIFFSERSNKWEHRIPAKQIEKIEKKITDLGVLDDLIKSDLTLYDFAIKVAGQKRAYKSAYKGCQNLEHLTSLIDQKRNQATLSILAKLFGDEAVEKLDARGKKFLNLSFSKVPADF